MTTVRRPLTGQAHAAVAARLRTGDCAIDATAGNGHDSLFLATTVGPGGHVWAFDVQQAAIDATAARLAGAGLAGRATLLCASHAEIGRHVPAEYHGRIGAVLFNLGYLPGSDKQITTQAPTTLKALAQSLELLRGGGIISVLAYPGHDGGRAETDAVIDWFGQLDEQCWQVSIGHSDTPHSPRLLTACRIG